VRSRKRGIIDANSYRVNGTWMLAMWRSSRGRCGSGVALDAAVAVDPHNIDLGGMR